MNKNTLSLIVLMTFQLIFSQEKTETIEEVVVKKETKTFTNTNGNLKVMLPILFIMPFQIQ